MKYLALTGAILLAMSVAEGQKEPCPVENGIAVTLSSDSAGIADSLVLSPFRGRALIDTTWRFDITERRWSREYFAASVGAGWSGSASRPGTTTAPDAQRNWSACASAAIGMRNPTLVLRGARGMVRLRADLRSLGGAGRRARADSLQPRR